LQNNLAPTHGCFNTTAVLDLDSEFDSYDPMGECFNIIDTAVATTDDMEGDGNATATAAPVAGADPRTPGHEGQLDPPPPQNDKVTRLA